MDEQTERIIADLDISFEEKYPYMDGQILSEPGEECVVFQSSGASDIRREETEHLKRFSERALDFA